MGIIFDPNATSSSGDLPAEQALARAIFGKLLPDFRDTVAQLNGLHQLWIINGMPDKITAAQSSGELIAGHPADTWNEIQVVFDSLQTWLATPIASIGDKTPAQVIMTFRPAQ